MGLDLAALASLENGTLTTNGIERRQGHIRQSAEQSDYGGKQKRRMEQLGVMVPLYSSFQRLLLPLWAIVVEMGGVEPPSKKLNRKHATGLAYCL
jgi:hypothetical protein